MDRAAPHVGAAEVAVCDGKKEAAAAAHGGPVAAVATEAKRTPASAVSSSARPNASSVYRSPETVASRSRRGRGAERFIVAGFDGGCRRTKLR
jgi:hypothetical protein